MRSSDRNNIFIIPAPNHHSKNPGWEFYPASQIKQQAEVAKQRELVKPSPGPAIKQKTLELKTQFKDLRKPKHIFKKVDIKEIGKQKREVLQSWISEENDLRKGIQKIHKRKEVPKQKEIINDEWPEMNEDQQIGQENASENNEENTNHKLKEQDEDINEVQSDQQEDQQDNIEESEEKQEQYEQSENQEEKEQEEDNNQIQNQSEVKSEVSQSFIQANKSVQVSNGSKSTVFGYKSQVADQMRDLLFEFE